MAPAHEWTEENDSQLRKLSFDGASWDEMATRLCQPLEAVMERARALGMREPRMTKQDLSNAREPLPAGHPLTWGPLVKDTLLEGWKYVREPPL